MMFFQCNLHSFYVRLFFFGDVDFLSEKAISEYGRCYRAICLTVPFVEIYPSLFIILAVKLQGLQNP
jgi:hypothetical protein